MSVTRHTYGVVTCLLPRVRSGPRGRLHLYHDLYIIRSRKYMYRSV